MTELTYENLHEVWIAQANLIDLAIDQARPLLNTLQEAIDHAPGVEERILLDCLRQDIIITLNAEATDLGLGKKLV